MHAVDHVPLVVLVVRGVRLAVVLVVEGFAAVSRSASGMRMTFRVRRRLFLRDATVKRGVTAFSLRLGPNGAEKFAVLCVHCLQIIVSSQSSIAKVKILARKSLATGVWLRCCFASSQAEVQTGHPSWGLSWAPKPGFKLGTQTEV